MGAAARLEALAEHQPLILGGAVLAVVLIVVLTKAARAGADIAVQAGQAAADIVGGAVTGDNIVTQTATDSAGQPVDAYKGAGIVGTVGAATNAVSGGVLASIGEWIGGKAFDLFGDPGQAVTKVGQGQAQQFTTGAPR